MELLIVNEEDLDIDLNYIKMWCYEQSNQTWRGWRQDNKICQLLDVFPDLTSHGPLMGKCSYLAPVISIVS